MTVGDALELYLAAQEPRWKASTCRTVRSYARNHVARVLGPLDVAAVDRAAIDDFHSSLSDRPHTANRCTAMLSGFFRWAGERGLRAEGANPCIGQRYYREAGRVRFLSPVEYGALWRALAALEQAKPQAVACLRLLVLTGCRQSEIRRLRWDEVRGGVIHLRDAKAGPRTVWPCARARAILERLPRDGEWVFQQPSGRPRCYDWLREAFRRTLERTQPRVEDLRLHDLRHSYASFALASGEPVPMIGRLLGHRDVETTLRYTHWTDRAAADAARITGEAPGRMRTLAGFTLGPDGEWRRNRLTRMKPSSRRTAVRALERDILPQFGRELLDAIRPEAVCSWFDALSQRAPGGANRTLTVFRAATRYAVSLGLIAADPTRHCRENPKRRYTRYLSLDEVAALHAALDAYRPRSGPPDQADIIRLLLLTGCRVGEIVRLRWDEVGDGVIRLSDSKVGPRTVWLGTEARAILETRERRGDWVFPDRRRPWRHRPADLCAWARIREAAGIPDVRLHDLRHTYASHAVMRGVPLPVVSRLLGHSSIRMTMRYAHAGDRETQAAADRIGAALLELLEASR